uniref:Heat shock protein 83 n=1 Tax=Nilaparvata lugens TaxID=108931 RepID=A0A7L7T0Y3_NILLU|nr:heat shock protein 90c [Nilaparvata lugens]
MSMIPFKSGISIPLLVAIQICGQAESHEFQAETRKLLDIVAKSLYSDKEVFIRELISNASDALEKQRYLSLTESGGSPATQMEIRISTDKQSMTLTIQDSGIGMTREELVSNLGTIARSGSKAFVEKAAGGEAASNVIGQFGVGFYSVFMVADDVTVYTRTHAPDAKGWCWTSTGLGTYEIAEASDVSPGTKIVMRLKPESREFADDGVVKDIIKKYSNFVGSPIFLNEAQINTIQPLWVMDPKAITDDMHTEFYRFVGNAYDKPRFTLHYKTDSPLMIQALLYFPETKPDMFDLSSDKSSQVALYSRRVLIQSKADSLLPKWLRFVKGKWKLRIVLTNKILRFLNDKSTQQPQEYADFYKDYNIFLKEGVITSQDQNEKKEVAKLLRYESSLKPAGETVSLEDYCSRLQPGQTEIYYLSAVSRDLALSSPYYEAMTGKKVEVLLCYEQHDEVVLMQLRQFGKYNLTSVEKEMRQDKEADAAQTEDMGPDSLLPDVLDKVMADIQTTLKGRVQSVRVNKRLQTHPCAVTVEEMAAARHFLKMHGERMDDEMRFSVLQPRLEINPRHPLIRRLAAIYRQKPELAALVTEQLFTNAMLQAGLILDARTALTSMNKLLEMALDGH